MKIRFKHQKFQADAAKAVVDVFAGQPYMTPTYLIDHGSKSVEVQNLLTGWEGTGYHNQRIVPDPIYHFIHG